MGRKLRVLFFIADLSGGGTERMLSILLRRLPRDMFDLHLCLWRPSYDYPVPEDVSLHLVEKRRPWDLLKVIRGSQRLVDELAPDIVFSLLPYTSILTGEALRHCARRPAWICRLGGPPEWELRGLMRLWARRVLRDADRVIGNSRGVSGAVVAYLGLDPSTVTTLLNPVETQEIGALAQAALPFDRPQNTFVFVHAGRLQPRKDQALLLQAFARVHDRDTELWILGKGPLEGKLKRLASQLGIADRVRWLGFQENPFRFYRAADCFVLSSRSEGMPNTLAEAMACGIPAISTRCDYGPEEVIEDDVTGRLVPVGDVDAMASAMSELAADRDRCATMGTAAQSAVTAMFDAQGAVDAYADLFRTVARREGTA